MSTRPRVSPVAPRAQRGAARQTLRRAARAGAAAGRCARLGELRRRAGAELVRRNTRLSALRGVCVRTSLGNACGEAGRERRLLGTVASEARARRHSRVSQNRLASHRLAGEQTHAPLLARARTIGGHAGKRFKIRWAFVARQFPALKISFKKMREAAAAPARPPAAHLTARCGAPPPRWPPPPLWGQPPAAAEQRRPSPNLLR